MGVFRFRLTALFAAGLAVLAQQRGFTQDTAFPPPPSAAAAPKLILPTDNTAIFSANPEEFYQTVERNFEGKVSFPWEGGQFGFVRSPVRTERGLVYRQFHEGLDIRPVKRDEKGEPLDDVWAIADGVVAHASPGARDSNYGKYVVVEHDWADGKYYSLYAHLAQVGVERGAVVKAGTVLGRMGYTGAGINKQRAHVHVELNLLISNRFDVWTGGSLNKHGLYNGLNLIGMDLATLFKLSHQGAPVTMSRYLGAMKPYYKVIVPRKHDLELVSRYPWMLRETGVNSPSWEISLGGSGLPLAVAPSQVVVSEPNVSAVVDSPVPHYYRTKGHLTGSGTDVRLTSSGLRYIRLLTGDF